jgi:glycosyltransferase involved in cell wall biosynthesis
VRFLMVTTFYPPFSFGGDATYVQRLSGELVRRGHEVEVVHNADAFRVLSPSPRLRPVGPTGVTVHALHGRFGLAATLLTQQTGRAGLKAQAIRRIVEGGRFDVIHFHNLSLIGLDVIRHGQAVKLYTAHEHWLVCPTHVLWRYNREACTRQTCLLCQVISRRPPQWWRYTSWSARQLAHVDRFLCPSQFTLEKHRALGFDWPMTHLPYFLPQTGHVPVVDRPLDRPYALFVGRLEKVKGVQNLLNVFRTYRTCDLVIAGDGEYESELRAAAHGLDHVHFLGWLPYEELRRWYRHALAVVVPSICYEVFGIVVIEAFAVSTPALVTPFGALPEVIASSGGGLVYHDDRELVTALERLRTVPDWRTSLGARGHDAYVRLWSEDPHIDRYLGVIDEVRSGHRRPTAGRGADPSRHA